MVARAVGLDGPPSVPNAALPPGVIDVPSGKDCTNDNDNDNDNGGRPGTQ